MEDFRKYATKHLGMNSNALDSYMNITSSYISPTIIEERQLNVAQMDVFSRLMMDRIIFLGTQVDDYTANVIQAQLLYLDSSDPGKDISIYINSPGGSVYAGYGIYDTMQFISSDVSTINLYSPFLPKPKHPDHSDHHSEFRLSQLFYSSSRFYHFFHPQKNLSGL